MQVKWEVDQEEQNNNIVHDLEQDWAAPQTPQILAQPLRMTCTLKKGWDKERGKIFGNRGIPVAEVFAV